MIFKKTFLIGCITLGLPACGGGGDEEKTAPPVTNPPVSTNNDPVLTLSNNDIVFTQGSAQSGDLVASYNVTDSDSDNVTVTLSDVTNYVLADGEIHLSTEGATTVNNGTDLPDFTLTPNDGTINGLVVNVDPFNTIAMVSTIGTFVSGAIWFDSSPVTVDGIVSSSGRLHLRSTAPLNGDYFHLSAQLDATTEVIATSTTRVYESIEEAEEIALSVGTGTLSGDISVNDMGWITINGNFDYEGENHKVLLENTGRFNDYSADFNTINKNWVVDIMESGSNTYATVSLAIDADGLITGSDDSGCVFTGTTVINNPELNAYEMDFVVSNCDAAGEYRGISYTTHSNVEFTNLMMHLSNATNSYWFNLRQ